MSTAPTNTTILDALLTKSVLIDLSEASSGSSSSSSSSTPANVISYTFSAGAEGWRNGYDTAVVVAHNAVMQDFTGQLKHLLPVKTL